MKRTKSILIATLGLFSCAIASPIIIWYSSNKLNSETNIPSTSQIINNSGKEIIASTSEKYSLSVQNFTSSIPESNLSYQWNVNSHNVILDSATINSKTVKFIVSVAGTYTFTAIIKNKTTNEFLSKINQNIVVHSKPILSISTSSSSQNFYINNDYSLIGDISNSKIPNVKYYWSVSPNDGIVLKNTTSKNVSFSAIKANNYTFTLSIKDQYNNLITSSSKTIIVNSSTPLPPTYSATINNPNNNITINNSYTLSVSVNPSGTYYYTWYGDNSLNITSNGNQVTIQPSNKGVYPINVDVFSDSSKQNKLTSVTLDLTINDALPPTVSHRLSWNNFNTYHNLNNNYQLSANLTNEPSGVYYEWTTNNNSLKLTNVNSKTVGYSTSTPGDYKLTLNAYENANKSNLLASKTAYISFNNLHTPTEDEIFVTNIKNNNAPYLSGGGGFSTEWKFLDEFNNFGVLNTYAFTTYMYLRSEFITRGFENVYYQLVNNSSYDDISFRIFGIATQDIATWGDSIAISTLVEGISGFNVSAGNKVDITLRFKRTDTVNQGKNLFNTATCFFKNANVTGKRNPNWGSPINNINPFYTSGWNSYATLKIDNNIIKDTSSRDNTRTVFTFAWKNGKTNYFVDKRNIIW